MTTNANNFNIKADDDLSLLQAGNDLNNTLCKVDKNLIQKIPTNKSEIFK